MKDKITKTFVLKKAHVTGDAGTLHDLIKAAMSKCDNAYDRQMEPEEGAERIRILNDWRFLGREEEVCVASFFSFTMNENKNAVVLKIMDAAQAAGYEKLIVAGEPLSKKEQNNLKSGNNDLDNERDFKSSVPARPKAKEQLNIPQDEEWNE